MSDEDSGETAPAGRDGRGRYAKGASGNPDGKPRGCLNRATRIAAELLEGEVEALWRTEIELAKAGDRMLLKHCNDKIIGPRRGQPVLFAMPPIEAAGDLAAAIGAVLRAAARGLITPAEAEQLARAAEAGARAVETDERIARERLAAEQEAVERRFALRACALLFWGVREIDEEAGDIDYRLRQLAKPMLRMGEAVLAALAALPDTPELVAADAAFLAAHPPRFDRPSSPLAAAMGRAWLDLAEYLGPGVLRRLEDRIEEREAAGKAPELRYRTGVFELLCGCPPPLQPSSDRQRSDAAMQPDGEIHLNFT